MATLYVTGFGVFEGVEDNPTQRIIENLRSDDDLGFSLKTDVMVVSVDGVNQFHESNPIVIGDCGKSPVLIHLGVNSGGDKIQLERFGYNNMTFRCKDESGRQADNEKITTDLELDEPFETGFDLEDLVCKLRDECSAVAGDSDIKVDISHDPGRFLCNYVYFQSMAQLDKLCGEAKEGKSKPLALFVHVPPLEVVSLVNQTMVIKKLLREIHSLYCSS